MSDEIRTLLQELLDSNVIQTSCCGCGCCCGYGCHEEGHDWIIRIKALLNKAP